MAGAFAGLVQCAVSTPVDLLKIRQQLQRVRPGERGYVGPLLLLRDTWRAEGVAGMRNSDPLFMLCPAATDPRGYKSEQSRYMMRRVSRCPDACFS